MLALTAAGSEMRALVEPMLMQFFVEQALCRPGVQTRPDTMLLAQSMASWSSNSKPVRSSVTVPASRMGRLLPRVSGIGNPARRVIRNLRPALDLHQPM
ncbi:hypothetical protein ACFFGH_02950 [Lysobacter korlensis]|uniref:Uncharacterized protein n=1 Tax=Lysobacter korlensis TaxID=553636 RepID=A0ABV6RIJ7_9GAMM